MYYASPEVQEHITHDCFNQNTERNCSKCPAHFSRRGICCFGNPEEHDPETNDCQECVYFHECAEEVKDYKRAERIRQEREADRQSSWASSVHRNTIPIRRPLSAQPRPVLPSRQGDVVQIGGLRRGTVITPVPPSKALAIKEGETMFQRFAKDTIWGMGQGFFETAAEFFRTHRLP